MPIGQIKRLFVHSLISTFRDHSNRVSELIHSLRALIAYWTHTVFIEYLQGLRMYEFIFADLTKSIQELADRLILTHDLLFSLFFLLLLGHGYLLAIDIIFVKILEIYRRL